MSFMSKALVTRIVVIGGRGFFGSVAADLLRREGERPMVASRRSGADLAIDAEDAASLHASLRAGDVVIDAAGPFQHRSMTLIDACAAISCDVIDLSDSLDYAVRLRARSPAIEKAGVRVLTSCSTMSAVSAALIQLCGVGSPTRVSAFLAPATGNTSTPASAASLLSSLARPVKVRRDGRLVERTAFVERRPFDFPAPVGHLEGRLGESPDAVLLPVAWPMLTDVEFWVDTRRRALNALFAQAARHRSVRAMVEALQPIGRALSKRFGPRNGGFAIEVTGADGATHAAGFVHASHSFIVAVAPAVIAARAIAGGRFTRAGIVSPNDYVDPLELRSWLHTKGIEAFG